VCKSWICCGRSGGRGLVKGCCCCCCVWCVGTCDCDGAFWFLCILRGWFPEGGGEGDVDLYLLVSGMDEEWEEGGVPYPKHHIR
jgi:hypothetical protein